MGKNWSDRRFGGDRAREFVEFVRDCAVSTLIEEQHKSFLAPKDKADLFRALESLRPAFDDLEKRIFDPLKDTQPELHSDGREWLWKLMAAIFKLGALSLFPASAKNYFSPEIVGETRSTQAATARKARAPKVEKRRADLCNAIIAEAAERELKLAAGNKFAARIRPGVRNRLGAKDGDAYPSAGTIKAAISELKKTTKT
ncbi:hypothetical protein QM467_11355 [Rhodoblastus sp. 17X3]|uniref:hypothetical protein n=1 Tax=Rhodoblastus sp. 17X3 TaxID=3047026 RepID=UPI0024B64524|nr:hypothetical protein [Rhodoblastus sp. 17X3]MDI9848652.1 hypothetical protein [Rhodoblastus sp. 17X3]